MVRRTAGLFRGIDLEDARAIRSFIHELEVLNAWLPTAPHEHISKLYAERSGDLVFMAADWVVSRMGKSQLLQRMIEDFLVYSQNISDELLVEKARILERLCDTHAQEPWFKDTYMEAEATYDKYMEHGILPEPYRTREEQRALDLAKEVRAFNAVSDSASTNGMIIAKLQQKQKELAKEEQRQGLMNDSGPVSGITHVSLV